MLPCGQAGVLVHEWYGQPVIEAARADGVIVAVPVEHSGRNWFELEWGQRWLVRSYGQVGRRFRVGLVFYRAGGFCSVYFKVSGIGMPMRSNASRWVLVGSVSMGTVVVAPAKRTSLRVRVARCSSRPRKLR